MEMAEATPAAGLGQPAGCAPTAREATASFLSELYGFLNANGYSLSPADTRKATLLARRAAEAGEELDLALKPALCRGPGQYMAFDGLFQDFLAGQRELAERVQERQELTRRQEELQGQQETLRAQEARLAEEEQEALASLPRESIAGKEAWAAFFAKNGEALAGTLGEELAARLAAGRFVECTPEELREAQERLLARAEEALRAGDTAAFQEVWTGLFQRVGSLRQESEREAHRRAEKESRIRAAYEERRQAVKAQLKQAKKEREKIQGELRALTPARTIVKERALSHREVFLGGRNAVQTLSEEPECLDTDFSQLTAMDRQLLMGYLQQNILRFRTRLTRHIHVMERAQLDMGRTIREACCTGGIPLNLCYERPREGKTNLLLMLDMSGSCRAASSMLLTFTYLLSSAFPQGCRIYGFVNRLYDISETLRAPDIDAATRAVFAAIPSRGVYSDYFMPLRSLWEEHRRDITSDTIVIFMGDARNNHHAPGYEELKNICHRAKRAYWLNTERRELWDTVDSLATGYGRYARIVELVNLRQLVGFIQNGIK